MRDVVFWVSVMIIGLLLPLMAIAADDAADRILIEKAAHRMTLYRECAVLKSYTIAIGRGGEGHKQREGDNRTPEGLYRINGRNDKSGYHRALWIDYPSQADREAAKMRGVPPGSDIMIHGLRNGLGWVGSMHTIMDWTAGCIAVTNPEIEEIWSLVPDGTPIEIRP